jgi:uncharacterized coiled-coil DUF342 family protein
MDVPNIVADFVMQMRQGINSFEVRMANQLNDMDELRVEIGGLRVENEKLRKETASWHEETRVMSKHINSLLEEVDVLRAFNMRISDHSSPKNGTYGGIGTCEYFGPK